MNNFCIYLFHQQILTKGIVMVLVICLACLDLMAQSITVTVKDELLLDIEQIDVVLNLKETSYDYEIAVFDDMQMPLLWSSKQLKSELDSKSIDYKLVETQGDTSMYYVRSTKKRQSQIDTRHTYELRLSDEEGLSLIKDITSRVANLKIITAEFQSKNEENTLAKLTSHLLDRGKKEADEMANLMGRKVTTLANIKILNKQTKGHPTMLLMYNLEQKAYMTLELTFETVAKE